jgi:hypothetical protein
MFARTLPCFKILTLEDKPFPFRYFCAIMKSVEGLVYSNLAFFGSGLSHFLYLV